jgi:nitrite reductase/ring-hydroxylating ferredoxin subunit/uncharacterized membrane protein
MSQNRIVKAIEQQDWLQPLEEQSAAAVRNTFSSAGPAGQEIKNALHGVWLGHPLHPAITDVPIGSWTVAAALDVMEMRGDGQYRAGADAAVAIGLLASVPAALSGMTDWSETQGTPRRVGSVHGLLNLSAAALYTASYAARKAERRALGRWLGFAAYGLVCTSAYLGGELSFSQKVGVNHAPDIEEDLPSEFVAAIAETDLQENKPAKANVNGVDIFLLRRGQKIYALANRCAHVGGPLSEGELKDDSIVCPWHGSRFCLENGKVLDGPATTDQPVLDVKVENGQVLVRAGKS